MRYTQNEMNELLRLYKLYLDRKPGGSIPNLHNEDLRDLIFNYNIFNYLDLRDADFTNTFLKGCSFQCVHAQNAIFEHTHLNGAFFNSSQLEYTNFNNSRLSYVKFDHSNLMRATFDGANLTYADFTDANLKETSFNRATLFGADFHTAKNIPNQVVEITNIVPPVGTEFVGYKYCLNDVIAKLLIPSGSKRSNATTNKCRAEYVKVLEVIGADVGIHSICNKTEYRVGDIIKCDHWEENRWIENGDHINFFLTLEEVKEYKKTFMLKSST